MVGYDKYTAHKSSESSASPSPPLSKERPVTPRHWLTGKQPLEGRTHSLSESPEARPFVDQVSPLWV